MKKRLLSAALALAMVLTMLPLSVFAADYNYASPTAKGDGTERVAWVQYDNAKGDYSGAPGWFVTMNVPAVLVDGKPDPQQPAKTVYEKVTSGLSVGGYYYKDAAAPSDSNLEYNYAADGTTKTSIKKNGSIYSATLDSSGSVVQGNLKGSVIVIGGTFDIDAVNASSLSLDVYGGTATIKQTATGTNATAANPTKLTSLTVNNSQYATYGKGAVDVSAVLGTLTSLTLNHVTLNNAVTLDSKVASTSAGQSHSLTLNDVDMKTNAITLNGVGSNTPATRAAQTLRITNSTVGAITVEGVNNSVTLTEVKGTPAVTIKGTGGTLTVGGGSNVGAVTLTGDTTSDKAQTTAPSSVTVQTGSTVDSISSAQDAGEQALGRQTISISGTVTKTVTAKNATMTVNGGQTGDITLGTGTLTVSGNRASVGDVTLTKDATFTLSGTNCTVGDLKLDKDATAATVTFNVPNDPSNTLGKTTGVDSKYTKQTIKGGTWKAKVPAANLDASLMYQLAVGSSGTLYTYYTSDQLGEAIIKQGDITGNKLTKIGDVDSPGNSVTFMNGNMVWGVLTISQDVSIPKLPTQMNNINTPYWSDGEFTNLAGNYSVPKDPVKLNAGGGAVSSEVTALTSAKVDGGTSVIKAALTGNVITLSGAVETGDTKFNLTLETDAVTVDSASGNEVPVVIEVGLIFDPSTKALTVANTGSQSLGNGVVIENTFTAIKLSNGTRYTFDGKGLVVRSLGILVKDVDKDTYPDANAISPNDIEVIVSAPGYTATSTLKQQIIDLINKNTGKFEWKNSAAVQQAVNAALATINDTTVQGYINAATARARSDNRLSASEDTGYQDPGTKVWLVPYLEVNVTNYQPNPYNPSLAATLTIKWRVEVHPGSTTKAVVKEAANVANDKGVYIAKQGVALSLSNDLDKGVTITLDGGIPNALYAHQADTYDYAIKTNAFTVTHAVSGTLGRFVLDAKEPLVKVGTKSGTDNTMATVTAYFSTLQAAVDAAEDQQLVEISSSYTGSTTINMTGKARTIYVQANGKNVVVANASGGLVEENSKGTFYTIKLNRDNSVTANAAISVNTATNGTATVDMTIAKPGATVSGRFTPNSGYKAGAFTATAQPGNKSVSVNVSADNTFSFVVPSDATSVTVTPSFVQDTGLPFTDVAANAWYFDGVEYCYNTTKNGYRLMEGMSTTTFGPNDQFTRAQVVMILWNMKGRPDPKTTTNPFSDITAIHYAYKAVLWAVENQYADGYSSGDGRPNGIFRPNQAVTRDEMVTFLWKAAGRPTNYSSVSLSGYSDGSRVPDWAQNAVKWAVYHNILSGQNSVNLSGSIAPRSVAYRREVAVTVMSFDKLSIF